MQQLEGFVLRDRSVICPKCKAAFAVRALVDLPPVTDADIIEADMHRVLPLAGLRAALLAVCPECNYADWVTKFPVSIINPILLPQAADVPHSSKFAMAVKHARAQGIHPLDIAYIAVNGLYCAREDGEDADAWLELCVFEQHRGLDPDNIIVETGSDHLMMGELWRQIGAFDKATEEYAKAGMDGSVPVELIRQQTTIARAGDTSPTVLPPWMVRLIFPEAAELAVSTDREPTRASEVIIIHCDPIARLKTDETGALRLPEIHERPEWARKTTYDLPIETVFDEVEPSLEEVEQQISEQIMEALLQAPGPEVESVMWAPDMPAQTALMADEIPLPEPDAALADTPADEPESNPAPSAQEGNVVPIRHVTAGGSLISLVPSQDGSSVSIAVSPSALTEETSEAIAQRYAADVAFAGAQKPNKEEKDPTAKALKRAMKAGKKQKLDTNEHDFPAVQILDEDSGYAYTGNHKPLPQKKDSDEAEDAAQPAAATTTQQAQQAKNPQQAIAQVESFLSLTRQPSYQNWVRGYRR
ncbi:MAG TPA: hypothetical protein V6D22_21530 [Candidatus Obscuribacterales bacterium]